MWLYITTPGIIFGGIFLALGKGNIGGFIVKVVFAG